LGAKKIEERVAISLTERFQVDQSTRSRIEQRQLAVPAQRQTERRFLADVAANSVASQAAHDAPNEAALIGMDRPGKSTIGGAGDSN